MKTQHCGCRDNRSPSATDLSLLLPERVCNRKGVPLSYLWSRLPWTAMPGPEPPPTGTHIYLVGHSGITVQAVYRDGVLVDPAEYAVHDGTLTDPVNLRGYCILVFKILQIDFALRLYTRHEGDRMTADITNPRCKNPNAWSKISALEARIAELESQAAQRGGSAT